MKTFCGPKCSLCCTLVSGWGIVQLGLMAIFFAIKSPTFLEDLAIEEKDTHDPLSYLTAMNKSFSTIATNCGIAAALYVVTLVVSGWQLYLNNKS